MTAEALFRAKISAPDERGCQNWLGCIGGDGYGHVRWNGKVIAAHRIAFALANGAWPKGHVLHDCDNPICCNPAHLKEGTHKQNMAECSARRRNRSPRPGNGKRKLSPTDIAVIRERYSKGETNKSALARDFGVTPPRIRQVLQR